MTGSPASAAVLGKVPWHPEFLRGSQLSSELWAFDQWLFRNAQSRDGTSPRLTTPLSADAPSASSYGFLLQLEPSDAAPSAIAGIVSPSRDLAGRRYPLAIAGHVAPARDVAAHPEIVPIVFEDYWHTAVDILKEARDGPPVGGDWRLERLSQTPLESGESALGLYVEWAERMDVPQLCSLLGRPPDWLAGAVAAVARAVGPKGGARVRSVRVPLGLAAGGALCFWLDVVRRAAGWQRHVPSFFWSHDEQGGDALVFVAAPGDTALATLWGGDAPFDDVCDITAWSTPDGRNDDGSSPEPPPPMALPVSMSGTEDGVWRVLESVDALVKAQTT
jgi:type VI secretion system ImpM family protein